RDLGFPEPRHPAAGVFQRQDRRALHVTLRTFEFLRAELAVADRFDLRPHQPDDLASLPRRRAGVRREQTDLRELRVIAVRRVREPALLAYLLEQTRGHPAAEGRIYDQEGGPFRVRSSQPVGPDHDVRLLGLLASDVLVPGGLGRPGLVA